MGNVTLANRIEDEVVLHLQNGADEEQAAYAVLAEVVTALYGDDASVREVSPSTYIVTV